MIGEDPFESVFLISSQLANEAIIGCQFLKEYGISLDFGRGIVSYVREDELKEYPFSTKEQVDTVKRRDARETERFTHPFPTTGQRTQTRSAGFVNRPSEPVSNCSGIQTLTPVAADSTEGIQLEPGILVKCVTQSRSECKKGRGPLTNIDAASDQVNYEVSVERYNSDVSRKYDSQRMGYESSDASPTGVVGVE
jgi:hypothetical protein